MALAVICGFTFTSCKDDDGPDGDDLSKVIVGAWMQDGDDDVLVLKSDGKGNWYSNLNEYLNNNPKDPVEWSYRDGWVTLKNYMDGGSDFYTYKLKAKSVTKDKIVWLWIDDEGEEDIWTWERVQ